MGCEEGKVGTVDPSSAPRTGDQTEVPRSHPSPPPFVNAERDGEDPCDTHSAVVLSGDDDSQEIKSQAVHAPHGGSPT